MPLKIIKGPPNSGRTEKLLTRYVDALPKRPVLVVPSTDDIFDWERRLMGDEGAFLGARIVHFKDMIAEVMELGPEGRRKIAGPLRRQDLTRKAMRESWPALERRVERQPGLVDAMLDLFDELRGALIGPEAFATRLGDEAELDAFLEKVADTYATYAKLLVESSLTDLPRLAEEAVSRPLDDWSGRPIFAAGFDDLSVQQLDLLEALAKVTDVTVAITYEPGNPAMAITEGLLGDLMSRGGKEAVSTERLSAGDHDELLYRIERGFLREDAAGSLKPDDALTVMRASGRRAEAESVAAEIVRLVDSGQAPGDIAIAVSNPSDNGSRFRDRLAEYGIKATVERETAAPATAIGRATLNLLRAASPEGSAQDFVAFLRGPVPVEIALVDELERQVLCEEIGAAGDAADCFEELQGLLPSGWLELTESDHEASAAVDLAIGSMLESILERRLDDADDSRLRIESRIATAVSRACRELDEMLGRPARPREIEEAIAGGAIKTWSVPDPESVVIASPYRLRAKRFSYLFMVSLQERGMGDPEKSGPFLTAESRSAVGLAPRQDAEDQERYLFYSCLGVPTEGLWLSSRVADETGAAEFPSPLVDGVVSLFDESSKKIRRVDRFASDVFFDPSAAPSLEELARSLVVKGRDSTDGLDLPSDLDGILGKRISSAREADLRTRTIDSLESEAARAVVGAIDSFGPTTLEAFTACPYRWFVDKLVRPSRFGPEPLVLARGSLVHEVLATLHKEPPRGMPTHQTVEQWVGRSERLIEDLAPDYDLGSDSAAHRLARTQSRLDIERFLRREAAWEDYGYEPEFFEVGFSEGSEHDALKFDGWRVEGFVDRIDVLNGDAVIIDYKSGGSGILSCQNIVDQGKLQLQLYMLAVSRNWKLKPVAALYMPVCATKDRPRGIVLGEEPDDGKKTLKVPRGLGDLKLYAGDRRRADDLEELLSCAETEAKAVVEKIQAGDIAHGPTECRSHLEHACIPEADLWTGP